jgi:hypothetical protein
LDVILLGVILIVILLSLIPSVILLIVIMLSVISSVILWSVISSVILLSVILLNVVAPEGESDRIGNKSRENYCKSPTLERDKREYQVASS